MKPQEIPQVTTRKPRQERSRYKVELILEATVRLLERDGIDALTTNAIAAAAGVSIGTLYQYFPNKMAILDALAEREMGDMAARVKAVMDDAAIASPEARISAIVGAVAASYGRRQAAHRRVMAHSLSSGGSRLAPLLAHLRSRLETQRNHGVHSAPLAPGDAFVLAHAFAGVLRAMTSDADNAPPPPEIERALSRLVLSFFETPT